MKQIVLKGSINTEMAKALVDFYNTLEKDNDCTVYFNSHGGYNDSTEIIIDQLRSHIERTRIVFIGEAQSNGFKVFVEMCKYANTEIVAPLAGMYHMGHMEVLMNANGPHSQEDREKVNYLKEVHEHDLVPMLCDFTQQEKNDFDAGKDVYFSHNRMVEIMKAIRDKQPGIAERFKNAWHLAE